jgi:SAM-dependent methyltransferase
MSNKRLPKSPRQSVKPDFLSRVYDKRWSNEEAIRANRNHAWDGLVRFEFSKLVSHQDAVIDIGCGFGDFINRISCHKRVGLDANPNCSKHLNPDVFFAESDCTDLASLFDFRFDVAFCSNFFEHLRSPEALLEILDDIKRHILKPGGLLIVMMPNSRKVGMRFWSFLDHTLPLNDHSLLEALELSGFQVESLHPKFFPYGVGKTRVQIPRWVINLYLRLPYMLRPMAGQMLAIAKTS